MKSSRPCLLQISLIAAAVWAVGPGSVFAARGGGREEPEPVSPFTALHETIAQEMQQNQIPGAAVLVMQDGQVTLAEGFGSKHPEYHDPVQASTLFRIGSVTKMLTAIGLLQQADAGWVDMNAPVTDYLPDFYFAADAAWASGIQVRDLLTHQSAMADYLEIDAPDFYDDDGLSRYFREVYPESLFAYLLAPPGRMYNYTNTGYMVAGWLTETVAGDAYTRVLQEDVLEPLGMHRTTFLPEDVLADGDFAFGLTVDGVTGEPRVIEPNAYDNGWGRPAGYAFSSVLDLAKLIHFLRIGHPEVLSDARRLAMQQPQVDTDMFLDLLHYGYGLMVQEGGFYRPQSAQFYRLRLVSHGGDVPGFSADLYYVPALDFGFIALANASYAHLSNSFVVALNTLEDLPAPAPVPPLGMSSDDYENYHGLYHDPYNAGDIRVQSTNSALRVEIPAFDETGLIYEPDLLANTPNNFVLYVNGLAGFDRFPLQVTFILDEAGRSEYFRTRGFVARLQTKDWGDPGDGRGRGGRRSLALSTGPPRFKPPVLPEPMPAFTTPSVRE